VIGSNREAFLRRVREAAASGRQYRVHTREIPPGAGYIGAGEDPLARLAQEVTAVGGHGLVVADREAARAEIAAQLARLAPKSVLCWEHPLLDRLGLAELIAAAGATAISHRTLAPFPLEEQRKQMLAADLCISSVSYAVAETGTLAVCSAPGRERCGSLIAPVHLALVEASQVLPDLFDLFQRFQAESIADLPSNITFITGPSKSGDIELTLTTGVHGPGEWRVVAIRDAG
jgi:L-lactate utilization protein LutC